jgi:tRNA G18 (ribose-2'-O)-methylase SpoU
MLFRKKSMEELDRPNIEEFGRLEKRPVLLVLDNIRSAMNVGSCFRTADAFALKSIHLCGISAKPPHREIAKTAIGAEQSVEWEYHEDVSKALKHLKFQGYHIVGVEQAVNSVSLDQWQPKYPLALVMGNEVRGITEDALSYMDEIVEIPQWGTKHSINVAVCAGIMAWESIEPLI